MLQQASDFSALIEQTAQAAREAKQDCIRARLNGAAEYERMQRLKRWFELHDLTNNLVSMSLQDNSESDSPVKL